MSVKQTKRKRGRNRREKRKRKIGFSVRISNLLSRNVVKNRPEFVFRF